MHIPERPRGRCTLPPLNEKYFLSVWIIILKCIQKLLIMALQFNIFAQTGCTQLYTPDIIWEQRSWKRKRQNSSAHCLKVMIVPPPKNKIKCCPYPSSGTEGSAHWRQTPIYTMKWHFTCPLIGERGPQLINKVVRCYLHKGINTKWWSLQL